MPNVSLYVTSNTAAMSEIMTKDVQTIFTVVNVVVLSELVSIFGVCTNTVTILVLVRQGFHKTINISLAGLAVSDFLSLLSLACLCVGNNPWLIDAEVPFDPVGVFYLTTGWPNTIFARITGWITAYISLERCLCVAMPLKTKTLLRRGRSFFIIVLIYVGVIASVCPIFVSTGLHWTFDRARNRTLIGLNFIGSNREEVKRAALWISNIFSPFFSFGIVIICTALLVIKLYGKSKWRQSVTTETQATKYVKTAFSEANSKQGIDKTNAIGQKDARVIKLVICLSLVYIISSLPAVLHYIWMILDPQYTVTGFQSNVHIAVAGINFLFQATNSSITFFVYLKTSSSFRIEFYKLKLFRKFGLKIREVD